MSASLAALQERFLASVLDGAPLPDAADPPDAVDFYRGAVQANLRSALAAAYPVVARLVGDGFFGEAARCYAVLHPSRSGDLHRFGERFAQFLESYAPARELTYLPDVARLEWAVHESIHAAAPPALDVARLAAVPEADQGRWRARLAPAVRGVVSAHAVQAIWEANQAGRDGTPARIEGPDHVLVRRPGGEVIVDRLDAAAWRLLQALAAGDSLERAVDALGDEAERFPALLAQWCAGGVIATFEPPEARA